MKKLALPFLILLILAPLFDRVNAETDNSLWETNEIINQNFLDHDLSLRIINSDGPPFIQYFLRLTVHFDFSYEISYLDYRLVKIEEKENIIHHQIINSTNKQSDTWECEFPFYEEGNYTIGVIQKDVNNITIGTLMIPIYPNIEQDAILLTDKPIYLSFIEPLKIRVENRGYFEVMTGHGFNFMKFENGAWTMFWYMPAGTTMEAWGVYPHNPYVEIHRLPLTMFLPGKYRAYKPVFYTESGIETYVEFYYVGSLLNLVLPTLLFICIIIRNRRSTKPNQQII